MSGPGDAADDDRVEEDAQLAFLLLNLVGPVGEAEPAQRVIGRKIQQAAGGLPQATLLRALQSLTAKRVVEATVPLSTKASRETRYAVADPHLRFWLAFLGPHQPEIERGRGDLVAARVAASWTAWRGTAIEPVIREALRRISDQLPGQPRVIGGYWTRTNNPEVDLVGADREPVASHLALVGSVKWRDNQPFDERDLADLVTHRSQIPGAAESTPLIVVSRSGTRVTTPLVLGPEDLLTAWR